MYCLYGSLCLSDDRTIYDNLYKLDYFCQLTGNLIEQNYINYINCHFNYKFDTYLIDCSVKSTLFLIFYNKKQVKNAIFAGFYPQNVLKITCNFESALDWL